MSAREPFFPWPDSPDPDQSQRDTTSRDRLLPGYTVHHAAGLTVTAFPDGRRWVAHAKAGAELHSGHGSTLSEAVRRALRALERSEEI